MTLNPKAQIAGTRPSLVGEAEFAIHTLKQNHSFANKLLTREFNNTPIQKKTKQQPNLNESTAFGSR